MRNIGKAIVGGLAMLSLILSAQSEAALETSPAQIKTAADHVDFLMPALGPFAYTHFCIRYERDCQVRGRAFRKPKAVALNAQRRADLMEINARVNHSIAPMRYVNDTTFDTWRVAPQRGDCNDYAVTKRHELLDRGWPTRALLLSEVVTPWGEHHLILLVRTDHGNFVLDNLHAQIRPWSRTGYQWVRIQTPYDPTLWSTIRDPHTVAIS